MKLQRFIKDVDLAPDKIRITDEEFINQVRNVFRLSSGDRIVIADGKTQEGVYEIVRLNKSDVELKRVEELRKVASKNLSALYCAVLKKENFEIVVQKAVECGVGKIVPVVTGRTIKLNLNLERLRKIAKEAAEQSGRADVPEILAPLKFGDAAKDAMSGLNLFLDQSGESIMNILKNKGEPISAWIGPEGGWTEEEIAAAKEKGFSIVSLGGTTLRGETAAIIASYLISNPLL